MHLRRIDHIGPSASEDRSGHLPEEAQGALPGDLLLTLGLMVQPVIEPVEAQLELLEQGFKPPFGFGSQPIRGLFRCFS